jgi:hypothetical protein
MKLDLLKIAVIAAVLFALAFVIAPLFAFRALKAAAQAEDAGALAELVDFPAVRRSLTTQLVPARQVTAEPPSIFSDPFGAFRRAIEPLKPPEPVVDGYLSPVGLAAMTEGSPKLSYWDTGRARIAVVRDEAAGRRTVLTFQRHSLFGWKLAHVQLPNASR